MQRHSFDPISFVFGVLFLAIAGWAVSQESLAPDIGQWLWPGALILVGLGLLASVVGRSRRQDKGRD